MATSPAQPGPPRSARLAAHRRDHRRHALLRPRACTATGRAR
jgi:hypothetical protein